jgi:hypothetical protein
MLRMSIVAILLCGVFAWPASPARAGAEWCDTDPLVLVRTPAGNLVPVFTLVGAQGTEHLAAALAASLLYTAATTEEAPGGRATRVTLSVLVPDDLAGRTFPVRAAASTGPLASGIVYAAATGVSGRALTLNFTLAVP